MDLPAFDFKLLLREVYGSGMKDLMALFDACISLCTKAYGPYYWECAAACHKHFNIVMPCTAEVA